MGKPKVVAKKAVKKREPILVKLSQVASKKFVSKGRKGKTMEYEELVKENERLRGMVSELEERVEDLQEVAGPSPAPIKWVRGKLPGEKYIKTDPETGKFEQIDKAEWDSLQ
jgi:hypothetical protein